MMESVQAVASAILVILGATAWGLPFSQWGAVADNELSRATRALGCGFVLLGYLVLLFGCMHALYPPIIAALMLCPLLWPGRARQVCALFLPAGRLFRQRLGSGWMGRYAAFVLVAVAICGLTPNTSFDVLSYHYAFPQIYLRQASLEWCWANYFEGLVQSVHMLYLAAMALGGELGANLLAPVFLVMLLSSAMETCAELEDEAPPLVAFLLLGSPLILFQALGGLVDLPLSAYTWMALASLLKGRQQAGHMGWCSLWCGAALSCKITAAASLFCLLPLTRLLCPGGWRRQVALLVLVSAMMASPWWIRNYLYTGDPLSPLLSNWQVQQWNWNLLDGLIPAAHAVSSPEVHSGLATTVRSWHGFRQLQDSVNFLIWGSPLLLLAGVSRRFGGLGVAAALAIVPYAFLYDKDARYGLPMMTWWSALSAVLLVRGQRRWPRLTSLALVLSCLPGAAVLAGILYQRLPVALGLQDRQAFLEQRSPQSAYRYLGRQAGAGQRVVVIGRLGFRCPLEYRCADSLSVQEWPKVSDVGGFWGNIDYFVVDLREPKVQASLLAAVAYVGSKGVVQPADLCCGPLIGMSPQLLESSLLRQGYAERRTDGLHLRVPDRALTGIEYFLTRAWRGNILFRQDGVLVLASPGKEADLPTDKQHSP